MKTDASHKHFYCWITLSKQTENRNEIRQWEAVNKVKTILKSSYEDYIKL